MKSKTLSMLAIIFGLALIAVALIYWFIPANGLPQFFPGYDASLPTIHFKHGLAAFLLGLALFAFAWFKSGSKSGMQ